MKKNKQKTFAVIQQNRPVVRQNGRPQRSRRKKGPIAGLCCRNLPQVSTADGNLAKKPEGIKDSSSIAYLIASYKKCRRRQEQIFVRQSLTGQLRGEMRNLANTATATMHHLHVMLTIQEAGCWCIMLQHATTVLSRMLVVPRITLHLYRWKARLLGSLSPFGEPTLRIYFPTDRSSRQCVWSHLILRIL